MIGSNSARGLLAVVMLCLLCFSALAQISGVSEEAVRDIVSAAKEDGVTVVVISPNDETVTEALVPEKASALDLVFAARDELIEIMADIPAVPQKVYTVLTAKQGERGPGWLPEALFKLAVAFAISILVERQVRDWGRVRFMHLFNPTPQTRSEKIGYLFTRGVLMSAQLFVAAFVVLSLLVLIDRGHEASMQTYLIIVSTVTFVRFGMIIAFNIIAPDAPAHRLIRLKTQPAKDIYTDYKRVLWLCAALFSPCIWFDVMGIDSRAHKVMLIIALLLIALALSWLCTKHRKPIGRAISRGLNPEYVSPPMRLLRNFWHMGAVTYFVCGWAVSAVRILLDMEKPFGFLILPIFVLAAAIALYGIGLIIIDQFFKKRNEIRQALIGSDEDDPALEAAAPTIDDMDGEELDKLSPTDSFQDLLEHGLSILVLSLSLYTIAFSIEVGGQGLGALIIAFVDILLILFVGYMAWRAIQVMIHRAMEDEEPEGDASDDESLGAGGASRLATLLPIFKNALFVTVIAITSMMVLAELGVDIGPIFAGAGIMGLAIGFGAQTLVRDVFSGAFFLIDDAFRKGEYISVGSTKGTVEKISVRSMQLRHHNGPLNTVPFGEITEITNFSRDWVVMKLPLRITYDTDVEHVRKLIKKLGQRLLNDELIGHLFLAPLKCQGVYMMEDSAIIIRIKFKTKPGDQFAVRKVVYAEIQKLFEEHEIKFAHREVTVRLADEDANDLTDDQKEAVAAAARTVIEDPSGAKA